MTGQSSWMEFAAAWTAPIVLPTLFLIAGLFLPRTLFGSKSTFFDRKVLRFVYFYLVWLVIQTVILYALDLAWHPLTVINQLLAGLVQPASGLWIIAMLALFHLCTWLVRLAAPAKILLVAALAQTAHAAGLIQTGWLALDAFAQYYVFFFAGYYGADLVRRYADRLAEGFSDIPTALVIWAGINTVLVAQNTAALPIVSLVLGFAGAFAIIAIAMPGLTSLAIGLIALTLPLGLHRLVRQTPLKALYRRPKTFRLKGAELSRGGQLIGSAHDPIEEA